jgi:hypothetical protein
MFQTALMYAVSHGDETISPAAAYLKGRPFIFSYLWLTFLSGLIVGGAVFAFIIPSLLFSLWFFLGPFILFDQNKKGVAAMLMSREYMRGLFWMVAGCLIVLGLITMGVGITGMLVVEGIVFIFKLLIGENFLVTAGIRGVGNSFINLMVTPLWFIYYFQIYRHIKARKTITTELPKNKFLPYLAVSVCGWLIMGLIIVGGIIYTLRLPATGITQTSKLELLSMQVPLSLYWVENNRYPQTLDELMPKYIESLPPGVSDQNQYRYTPAPDGSSYKLCSLINGKVDECVENDKTLPQIHPPEQSAP